MVCPGTKLLSARLTCRFLVLLLVLAAPVASAEPFRVLSQNMDQLFDNVDDGNGERMLSRKRFQQRVKLAAREFATRFGLPHIIALQEVENRNVLQQIANQIRDRYQVQYDCY